MMRTGMRGLLVVGFGLALAVLALNALISARNLRRLGGNSRGALQTAEALRDLEEALSLLKDAETGQRGYLLTGREEYLAPYRSAVASFPGAMARLDGLLDDPGQRRRLGELEAAVRAKLDELSETVDLRRREGLEAATRVVASDRGRRAMDDIRRLVAAMEDAERALLARRIDESESSLAWASTTFAVATMAAAGLVAALGLGVARHLDARERSEAALRHQAERWRVTLSSIGDGVIVTDAEGRVTFLNTAAALLCGREDDVVGRPLDEVFRIVGEETRQPVESPVARVLREGVVVGLANRTILLGRDGVERPIHDSAAPIRDGDRGPVIGVVLVFRDDTQRRAQEKELMEASRRKDEFLAMLAHELRNPLAAIRSAVATFDMPGGEDHAGWAREVIGRQVTHLAHLLDDLLDVSRITRGLIRVRKQLLDAYPVINQAVESVRPLMGDRRHRLEVSISPQPLRLEADPVRLEQILVNLLTNAARYTHPGGRIRLIAEPAGDRVVFRVLDDGPGIAPEVLPRIFDLFAQGDRSLARTEGGLGVGLTIVRKLVELHGGSVSARSDGPGLGSEFIVRLPAAEDQPAAHPAEGPPAASSPPRRATRILIVDDNEDLAQGMGKLLGMLGHEVRLAHDGPDGLDAARSFRPDVILLDIGLPSLDGYHVARALRQDGFKDTRIIAISGYGQEEDRRLSLDAGMDHHLTKPVDLSTLAELIGQPA